MRNKGSALLKGIIKFALATALFMGIALFTGLVPVAKAADSRVSTLEALRNAVYAGGKIVLEADISLDSDASDTDKSDNYLTINSNTVLDLNGHRIYRELSSVVTNGYIIYVPADRSLTILDSTGGGGLTGGNSTFESIRPSAVYVKGTLVLNGGSIRDNRNAARGGGAVVVEGGSFTMNGGEICGNEGKDGGVVVANGRFTMNGGSIHGNNGTSNAGGVYMTNNATNVFTMNGGYIRDNTCRDRGAGVYVQDGKFTLNGGQIRGNRINSITSSAMGCGGGVYVEYGSFTMTGGSITGNSAYPGSASARGENGGGVYLSSNSSGATISGGRITGNTTGVGNGSSMQSGSGAGIYVGSRLTVSGAPVIAGNTQDGRPNDLYLKSGKLTIGEGGLQAGASIGIMHFEHNGKFRQPSPTTFTEGLVGNTGVFFANAFYYNILNKTYEYAIQRDGDEAQLTYVGDSDLTVTFMRGDGTDAVHATQRVISGGSASRPAEPVWNGYVFEGWHTDAVAATPYAFGGELTDNLTLYAHWVESATVTFHANGGMGGMEPQVFGKGLEQNLNPSLFFRDYCIFDGWTANADGTGAKYADRAAITVTGDTNLYALWTQINFNITIAGTSNGTVTAKVGEKDNATTANYNDTVTLTVTPDPGYMLDTLTVKQGEADVTVTDNRFTMPAGDVTVSATFKLIPATAPAIDTQPSDLSLTYGYTTGSVLSVAASAAEGHTLSYQWYSNVSATSEGGTEISGATEASYAVPTGKIAGTTEYYYCVVTATHTDNSQTAETTSNTATVSIGKAPLTITANSKSIYVGDAIPALDDYKVEWLLNQDALTTAPTLVYQKNGEVVTPDNTTAGTYDIVPSGANAGNNYSISYTNGTLTISEKQTATVTKAPTARSLTYNGQEQELVTAGTASGGTMQYAIGTDEATAPTDETLYTTSIPAAAEAGTYNVWYYVKGDGNHLDTKPAKVVAKIVEAGAFGTPDFTLPASLQAIEANAFEGASMTVVYIPDTCVAIGAEAFKGCAKLKQIRLPKDCAIEESAFDGCGLVYAFAPAGGTTEAWCAKHRNICFIARGAN